MFATITTILKLYVLPTLKIMGEKWLIEKFKLNKEFADKLKAADSLEPAKVNELAAYLLSNPNALTQLKQQIQDPEVKKEIDNKARYQVFSASEVLDHYNLLLNEIFAAAQQYKKPIVLAGFFNSPNVISYYRPNTYQILARPIINSTDTPFIFGNSASHPERNSAGYTIYIQEFESSKIAVVQAKLKEEKLKHTDADMFNEYKELLAGAKTIRMIFDYHILVEGDNINLIEMQNESNFSGYEKVKKSFESFVKKREKEIGRLKLK